MRLLKRAMIFNTFNITFFLLVSSINFVFIESDKGLLLDLRENSLVQVEAGRLSSKSRTFCHNCAIACPVFTSADNNGESVGKNALVIKKIYERSVDINQIELPRCNGIIQTSYLYNKLSGLIEIGYEIHGENDEVESFQMESNKDDYLSLDPSHFTKTPIPKQDLLEYIESNKYKSTPTQPVKFIWIPILLINLDIRTMSPTRIQYKPDLGIHEFKFRNNCSQFKKDEEFYGENIHQSFYSEENQRLLFTGDKKQQFLIPEGESPCGQNYRCLIQHQIIPTYYMHSLNGKTATCTRMNTVPVWDGIVERINIVNKYIYAMSQIWTSQIHLTTGFFKILKPSRKYFEKIPVSDQELYLDKVNGNFPVPMIIYKIVDYRMKIPLYEDGFEHNYAVIVIHNDPTPDADKEKLCSEKDMLKGWEDIENNDVESGFTYVCSLNETVAQNLNFMMPEDVEDGYDLKPDGFPVYNISKKQYFFQDKKSEIEQKIEELF